MLSGEFPYSVKGSPVFYSVTEHGEISANIEGKMIDVWDYYLQNPTATATQLRHTPYIILFPYFWTANPPQMYGDIPPTPVGDSPASNCLTVNTAINRFRLTDALHWGGTLIQYRMWLLMEELAHYYTTQSRGKTNDVQNANTLFWLSAKDSLETVQAYMYYTACELSSATSSHQFHVHASPGETELLTLSVAGQRHLWQLQRLPQTQPGD